MGSRVSVFILMIILLPSMVWGFDHQHKIFSDLLKKYVEVDGNQSRVDYGGFKKDSEIFDNYLKELEDVNSNQFYKWSNHQQVAYLINSYNAYTISLILTKYPDLKSIKDLGGWFSSPWKKRFFKFLGKEQHLDYLEHHLLRKKYFDPRLHFVLVCASISCPPLLDEAYTADKLDGQMEKALSYLEKFHSWRRNG